MTREDLAPGYQIAQSCHALKQFDVEHPDVSKEWFEKSNYIACLSAKDENALIKLIGKCEEKEINFSIFFEPDLDYQITAVALEPGVISKKLCSNFRLALNKKE